jgi:hypothetical protein
MDHAYWNSATRGPCSSDQATCAVTGCEKRINQKCARHACAGHCRIQGLKLNGDKALCSLVAHAPKNSETQALPRASCRCRQTTTPTGQVTLTTNGGKRGRRGGGSSMGADAASWTVSAGFQPLRWCSGGYVLPSPLFHDICSTYIIASH